MSFDDPSIFTGSDEEITEKVRKVKEQIKAEVLHFMTLVKEEKLKENFPKHWQLG